MSGEVLNFNIPAGGQMRLERAGSYFEILDSTSVVNVDLYGKAGNVSDNYQNIPSGFFVTGDFSSFVVKNPGAAQTVSVLITDAKTGGTRRQPGIVQVRNNEIGTAKVFVSVLNSFTGPFNVSPVVPQAQNTKGIVIRHSNVMFQGVAGTSVQHILWAAPSVPTSMGTGTNYTLDGLWLQYTRAQVGDTTAGNFTGDQMLQPAVRIPAGWGVWMISAVVSGTTGGQVFGLLGAEIL